MVKVWNIVLRLVVLLFLAGNTLLLILMIISGATDHYPVTDSIGCRAIQQAYLMLGMKHLDVLGRLSTG